MSAEQPTVGETWEMIDPFTGHRAQAVVVEVSGTSIQLLSRQQQRLRFPAKSFLLTWHFVQKAPEQHCAFVGCTNNGYFQINDLGRWVWVCHLHLATHMKPLLPIDNTKRPRSGSTIPEIGSCWINGQTNTVITVSQILFATHEGQSGRLIRIDGVQVKNGEPVEVWLEDFVKEYTPHLTTPVPCAVGEVWIDSSGREVEVVGIENDQVVVILCSGCKAFISTEVFRSQYQKQPPRRSAFDRLLEDEVIE